MTIEIVTNLSGEEVVNWTDEQGQHSMLKSAWDELQAKQNEGSLN